MTRIDIALKILDIPANWQLSRYPYGQVIVFNNKFCKSLEGGTSVRSGQRDKLTPRLSAGITHFMSHPQLST